MAYAPDLSRLLTPGARYADEHDEYVIEPHPIGDVTFPTGQVVGWTRLPPMTPSPSRSGWRRAPTRCGPGSRSCTGTAPSSSAGWRPCSWSSAASRRSGEPAVVEDVYIPAGIPLAPVPGVAGAVTDEPTRVNVILRLVRLGRRGVPDVRRVRRPRSSQLVRHRLHARPGAGLAGRSGLQDRLELDLDADLPGDHEPAAVQRQVPGQAPVLPVDGARRGEDDRWPPHGSAV